jgi:thiol-disulfide isomerase/thioredoxin
MKNRIAVALLFAAAGTSSPVAAQQSSSSVGSKAPVVTVADLDGQSVNLGQYIGKRPLLLEFWATWCELCEELLPRVRAAQATFGKDVEFFGINVTVNQTPEKVRRYLAQHKPAFRTLYDEQGTSTRAYQVPATSYIVIIDRHGTITYTGSGGTQDLDAPLRQVTRN